MKNSRPSWTCTRVSAKGAAGLLLLGATSAAYAQNAAVTISVDVNANRHAISPLIYGMAYAGANIADLNCPINRYGGNNASR